MNWDIIQPYSLNKFSSFSASLSDILAVKYGIKPLARLSCTSLNDFYAFKKHCEYEEMYITHSKYKILFCDTVPECKKVIIPFSSNREGVTYLYLSKSKKLSYRARDNDPEVFTLSNKLHVFNNHSFSKNRELIRYKRLFEFATLLGYPKCCIEAFLNKGAKELLTIYSKEKKASFYLNNFFHSISNYYISFHLPCSYKCKNSLDYNAKIYEILKQEVPSFSQALKSILRLPLLVCFLEKGRNCYFDYRVMVIFDGSINNNTMAYRQCFLTKTPYFDIKDDRFIKELMNFRLGNRVLMHEKKFNVYHNDTLLHSFKMSTMSRAWYLFNFT